MDFKKEDIAKLAQLSRLSIDDASLEVYTGQLNKVMAMVEQLQEVDTTGVEPLFHVGAAHNATRQDEVMQTDEQEMDRLMSDEQRVHAGLYKVKKVL